MLLGAGSISQALDEMALLQPHARVLRPHREGDRHLEGRDHARSTGSSWRRPRAGVARSRSCRQSKARDRSHDRAQPTPAARAHSARSAGHSPPSGAGSGSRTRSPPGERAQALAAYGVHFSLSSLDGLNGGGSSGRNPRGARSRSAISGRRTTGGPRDRAASTAPASCSGRTRSEGVQHSARHLAADPGRHLRARAIASRPATWCSSTTGHHVGMYLGHGAFVQAPHTGDVVKVSTLDSGYYASEYFAGIRVYS